MYNPPGFFVELETIGHCDIDKGDRDYTLPGFPVPDYGTFTIGLIYITK